MSSRKMQRFKSIFVVMLIVAAFSITGCGSSGGGGTTEAPPMVDPGPTPEEIAEQEALEAAKTATAEASTTAAAAVAAVEADKDSDLASYARAQDAAADAAAANERAQAATTSEAAKAAQADAEAALESVNGFAGMVTAAQMAAVIVQEITDAKDAAAQAAADAAAAVAAVAVISDSNSDAYAKAQAAVQAAIAANLVAQAAITQEAAVEAQKIAKAEEANAVMYAGMVTASKTEADRLAQVEADRLAEEMKVEAAKKALADEKTAAMGALDTAKAALAGVEGSKSADLASYARAEDAVADAEAANEDAQAAETLEETQAAKARVVAASDKAARFAGMVSDAKAEEDRLAKLEEERLALEAKANEDRIAMNKELETKVDALTDESKDVEDVPSEHPSTEVTATVSHEDGAQKVVVKDSSMARDEDPKFKLMDGKYERDTGNGVTDIVVVHTDIDAPTNIPFSDEEKEGKYTLNAGGTLTVTTNHVEAMLVKTPTLSATGTTATETFNPVGTVGDDVVSEVGGMFDGAQGTYSCSGSADCTLAVNNKGEVSATTGAWIFTPATGATIPVPDPDYLTYGVWLTKTTKDGVTEYNQVETFARSYLPPSDAGTFGNVSGTAEYEGDAAGVYVNQELKQDGSVNTSTGGTFTADVALKAYFGEDDDIAVSKQNSVEGTVSKFELSGGEENGWSVELKTGKFTDNGTFANSFKGNSVGKTGDKPNVEIIDGWTGQFHGAGKDLDGDGEETAIGAPPVVVGEFNANFINGAVAGGFGTRVKP